MFARRRVVAACLAFALLGLSGLFLYATTIEPRALRLADVGGDDVGSPVRVRGHVHRAWTTDEGNAGLVLMDYEDFATLRVVARARAIAEPTLVAPGALVEVVGDVFRAGGLVQVFAEAERSVRVIEPPSTNLLPLDFVAANAMRLEGQHVVVRATLADLYAVVDTRHALLRSDGAEVWAYAAEGWPEGTSDVTGRLRVTSYGRCELFAAPEPLAVETTLPALAACPEVLLDQPVSVRGVRVEVGELVGTGLTLQDVGDGANYRMAAFVEGWDWRQGPPLTIGCAVTFGGVVEFRSTEARWQLVSDSPPNA